MAIFNEEAYLAANLDVAQAVNKGEFLSGWQHWSLFGEAEGRTLAPATYGTFNESAYLAGNPDVAAAVTRGEFIDGWQHYDLYGRAELRTYAVPDGFNEAAYLDANPDVALVVHAGLDANYTSGLAHWLLLGAAEPSRLDNMTALLDNSAYQAYQTAGGDTAYLAANIDVADAVQAYPGHIATIASGWAHYQAFVVNGTEDRPLAPAGFTTPIPTYSVTASAETVIEGADATFTIATTDVPDGLVAYTLTGVSPADVTDGLMTGSANVIGGHATIIVHLVADFTTEGAETLVVTLDGFNRTAQTIVNDTSAHLIVNVAAAGSTDVAAFNTNVIFAATPGGYDYNIANFAAGDKIDLPDAFLALASFTNNSRFDGTAILTANDGSSVIKITLTGLDQANDQLLTNTVAVVDNTAFGSDWIF